MAKWVCSVCGYVHEGDTAPEKCPQCGVPAEKFTKQEGELTWAAEHVVGVASDVPEDIKAIAVPVLAHRLTTARAFGLQSSNQEIMKRLLSKIPLPTEDWSKRG